MTDFMRWLYANYIKPQVEKADSMDYGASLSLMDTALDPELKLHYARTLEFFCIHAFLLGLRTGAGMSSALSARPR